MVKPVKLDWNLEAFNEIREDPDLRRMVDDVCEDTAADAGDGFGWKAEVRRGKRGTRYRGVVFTDSYQARKINQRNNTLLHVLRGR